MRPRKAEIHELDRLAQLWHDGWREAHAAILPAELSRYRTLPSFRQRLEAGLPDLRVAGPVGDPLGLCMIKEDELYQLYVSPRARGTGVAADLLADGERRIAATGVETAWLACAIGNSRAAAFYEKHAWMLAGNTILQLPTPDGPFPLEVWRYEKALGNAI
jgi:GNAT superfamily N-acetyltransferase